MGEGPAVNVFSAWASTGEADKEKILFKEGLRALKVMNASQYLILPQKQIAATFYSLLQSDSGFRAKFAAFMTEQVRIIMVRHVSVATFPAYSPPTHDGDRLSSGPPSSSRCQASPPPPPSRGPSSSP